MAQFLLILIILVGVFVILLLGNVHKGQRYKQYWAPIKTFAIMCFGMYAYYRFGEKIGEFQLLRIFTDYADLAFTLFIIGTYALIKLSANEFGRFFGRRKKEDKPAKVPRFSVAYKLNNKQQIVLKKEWAFPRLFLYYLSWLMAIALFLLIVWEVIDIHFDERWFGKEFLDLPVMSALSLVVVLESYWYLQHDLIEQEVEQEQTKKEETTLPLDYYNLWEEYQTIWKDHLALAWHFKTDKQELPKPQQIEIPEAQVLVNAGYDLNVNEYHILEALTERRDLLIDDVIADDTAPLLFNTLLRRLMDGENILILTPHRCHKDSVYHEQIVQWINDWLYKLTGNRAFWRVNVFSKLTDIELNERIVVSSADDLLDKNVVNYEWFSHLKTILYLSGEEVFSESLTSNYMLINILRQQYKDIQCVVLSNYRATLKDSVARNLKITKSLEEERISHLIPLSSYILFWRLEGEELFQHKVLAGVIGSYLGAEAVLALLPRRERIEHITMVGQEKLPHTDNLNEVDNNKNSLQNRPISAQSLRGRAEKEVRSHLVTFLMEKGKNTFILARDTDYNAISTLQKWHHFAYNNAFVHVVSPPYLLRDYFVDNTEYFYKTPLYPLSSKIMISRFEIARKLLEMLVSRECSEQEILEELVWIFPKATFVRQELHQLFRMAFNIDIIAMNYVQVSTKHEYDKQYDTFNEVTRYQLALPIKENINLEFLRDAQIVDNSGNVLKVMAYDLLFQNYLPGQLHAFNGKSYYVKGFDQQNSKLRCDEQLPKRERMYRMHREVELLGIDQPLNEAHKMDKDGLFTLDLCEGQFNITTKGYYTFERGILAAPKEFTYTIVRPSEVPVRHYPLGRIGLMTINVQGMGIDAGKVTGTLVVLLQELLPSLFPETHQYLLISSLINTLVMDGEFQRLYPTVMVKGRAAEIDKDTIQLCLIEDAHQDMGVVQSVFDRYEYIFEILDDYLYWLMTDGKHQKKRPDNAKNKTYLFRKPSIKKSDFLKYGLKKYPDFFDLSGTVKVLKSLVRRNFMTRQRIDFYK